jgi:energy-coupling factor transporter transmembrane protein EcfT
VIDPHTLFSQVSHGEIREEWLVRRAKDHSRMTAITVGLFVAITWVPMLTIFTLIVSVGSIPSNPLPLLLRAPWLVLPALFLSAAFVYTAWRSEKTKGDKLLILLPEGIVEYEHWSKSLVQHIITDYTSYSQQSVSSHIRNDQVSRNSQE